MGVQLTNERLELLAYRMEKGGRAQFEDPTGPGNDPAGTRVVLHLSADIAEQRAYYRFLNNAKVKETELVAETAKRMEGLSTGRHLLCIQDTCEVNLQAHQGRLMAASGLGRSDNADSANCFKLHPGLVVDADHFTPLGFSHVKLFHRPEQRPSRLERNYKRQPIEEKESYKWIEVAQRSKEVLKEALSVTFIEDREGDIYEQFALIPEGKYHLLVRSKTTRELANGNSLYEDVGAAPMAGTYTIALPTDSRKQQYRREAHMELRYLTCWLQCPSNLRAKNYPDRIEVTCIEVRETGGNATSPIHWRSLTTHRVTTCQEALKLVGWYSARWHIEQLFRLLKKQGFGIEEAELESGWAVRKLVVMQMTALLKILQMNIAYNDPEGGQPIEEVFDASQIEAMRRVARKLQGRTTKQQNHNDPKTTKWAAWVIGRLGGWKGYDSQGPPGVIALRRGLDRLTYIMEGMELARDVHTR